MNSKRKSGGGVGAGETLDDRDSKRRRLPHNVRCDISGMCIMVQQVQWNLRCDLIVVLVMVLHGDGTCAPTRRPGIFDRRP